MEAVSLETVSSTAKLTATGLVIGGGVTDRTTGTPMKLLRFNLKNT